MRKPLVVGNWKMNATQLQARALAAAVRAGLAGAGGSAIDCAVCPAYVLLPAVAEVIAGAAVALGAQDLCEFDGGAYTGAVSGAMLVECGCRWVIVGHSERRHVFGEADARVAAKFSAAHRVGLWPIVCVGETIAQRRAGQTESVVLGQLDAVLAAAGPGELARTVIAYEPVWAIGTGENATPAQAQDVHALIRARVARADAGVAAAMRILYGGSVKSANAADLFGMRDVDGGLIGGASLKADDFLGICQAASHAAGG